MSRHKIADKKSQPLVKLGLTPDEARCYEVFTSKGTLNVAKLAQLLNILPNATYRLLLKLKSKGFIVELDTHPVSYQPLPPEIAISSYAENKLSDIQKLSSLSIKQLTTPIPSTQTHIEQLTGKRAMFIKSLEMIKKAKTEILIISIGEPVQDEIKLENIKAIDKGVNIKFIAHKYNKDNKILLQSWIKMGLEVKHLSESGYHLQIIDGKKCLLSASNPKNTDERSSVVIHSSELSNAMRNYFYSLWEKATLVKLD